MVKEPIKGFILYPKKFGMGVVKLFWSLIYGKVGDVFDRERNWIKAENEPANIISGLSQGFTGFRKEIGKGFYIFCYESSHNTGADGASKGSL